MNKREREIVALFQNMQKRYGAVGLKAEFEAEGTRFEELLRLKEIASNCAAGIALKIGGPEDVWGILQARRIGVSDIVAPMVESAYALEKFLAAIKKHVPEDELNEIGVAINIETRQAFRELDKMVSVGKVQGLTCMTVGRVDLVGSLGLSRKDIDSPVVSQTVRVICEKARKGGFRVTIGGSIERTSLPILNKLVDADLLDRFETRKVIFVARFGLAHYDEAVRDAHRFEHMWLENKRDYYGAIANEDADRILMLQKRLQ